MSANNGTKNNSRNISEKEKKYFTRCKVAINLAVL